MTLVAYITTRILRAAFFIMPALAPYVAKAGRAAFSNRINNDIILQASLGFQKVRRYPARASSLAVNIWLPIKTDLSLDDYTQASAYYSGLPPLCVTLMEHASERALFFDIGANIGLVSAAVGKVLPPQAIHAFEANPSTFPALERTLQVNCPGAHAHCIALSDHEGSLEMSVIGNDSGSSSVQVNRFDGQSRWHGQPVKPNRLQVPAIPLFEWVQSNIQEQWDSADVVLVKIDVEGHELEVLKGMNSLWNKGQKKAVCVVEVENKNIETAKDVFAGWGFKIHRPSWNPQLLMFPHHTDLAFIKAANA